MHRLSSLLCGLLFGAGLALSGMTDPAKVLGFLDVAGQWDPALIFVMGGAVCVTVIAFRFVLRLPQPCLVERFHLPGSQRVDAKLLAGAAIFGIGWGLAGYCPGPALVALGYLQWQPLLLVVGMLLGGWLAGAWLHRRR